MGRDTNNGSPSKAGWRAPKVEDLGNLRDFVRVGNANGKSGVGNDGNSVAGGETMTHQ